MSNPNMPDRRDVAHATNPIGGRTRIEQDDPGRLPGPNDDQTRTTSLAYTDVQPAEPDRQETMMTKTTKVTGGPLDISGEDILQNISDSTLKGGDSGETDPDELPNLDAIAELSREKNDAYLVRSDLEDDDQRGPSPAMKDQDR